MCFLSSDQIGISSRPQDDYLYLYESFFRFLLSLSPSHPLIFSSLMVFQGSSSIWPQWSSTLQSWWQSLPCHDSTGLFAVLCSVNVHQERQLSPRRRTNFVQRTHQLPQAESRWQAVQWFYRIISETLFPQFFGAKRGYSWIMLASHSQDAFRSEFFYYTWLDKAMRLFLFCLKGYLPQTFFDFQQRLYLMRALWSAQTGQMVKNS